jgi:cysteine sulfinate desulfinase/cysteine desulfurase-like protein
MGVADRAIRGAIRFSLGPQTEDADLDWAAARLAAIVTELRGRRS